MTNSEPNIKIEDESLPGHAGIRLTHPDGTTHFIPGKFVLKEGVFVELGERKVTLTFYSNGIEYVPGRAPVKDDDDD